MSCVCPVYVLCALPLGPFAKAGSFQPERVGTRKEQKHQRSESREVGWDGDGPWTAQGLFPSPRGRSPVPGCWPSRRFRKTELAGDDVGATVMNGLGVRGLRLPPQSRRAWLLPAHFCQLGGSLGARGQGEARCGREVRSPLAGESQAARSRLGGEAACNRPSSASAKWLCLACLRNVGGVERGVGVQGIFHSLHKAGRSRGRPGCLCASSSVCGRSRALCRHPAPRMQDAASF